MSNSGGYGYGSAVTQRQLNQGSTGSKSQGSGSVFYGVLITIGLALVVLLSVAPRVHQVPDGIAGGATSLLQTSDQTIETIKLRGNMYINQAALTEGPRRFRDTADKKLDQVESYFSLRGTSKQQKYIVGWKPVVNKHKCADGSVVELVHHLNAHSSHSKPYKGWNTAPDAHGAGLHLVASYDRGATEYHLPSGYGIPIDKLTLEHHLLIPPCWDLSKSVLETSGFDLYVTSQKPKHMAALVGLTDENMRIQPGQGVVDHVTKAEAESLRHLFKEPLPASLAEVKDVPGGPTVDLLAVHLHTHDITTGKFFEVLNPDGSTLFRSKEEATGYGDKQQSFIDPKAKGIPSKIKPGQSLRMHCKYDTNKLQHDVVDGTSHGEEMCSALLLVGGDGLNPEVNTLISELEGGILQLGRSLRSFARDVAGEIWRLI